jgi:hypothetical protein
MTDGRQEMILPLFCLENAFYRPAEPPLSRIIGAMNLPKGTVL